MKTIIAIVLVFLGITVCVGKDSAYTVEQAKDDKNREMSLDVNAWLNRLTYAYFVATSSHNKLVVSNELNKLRFDKYDYPHIVDCVASNGRNLETAIGKTRKCLSDQMNADRRFDHFMELVEDRRRRAWKELWLNMITFGLRSLGRAGDVVARQSGRGDSVTISANACMTLAGDLLGGPMNAIVDYDRELDRCGVDVKKAKFKHMEEKNESAEEMQAEMFNCASSFAKDMHIEIIDLDSIHGLFSDVHKTSSASDSDALNKLLVLLDTESRRDKFKMYAPYWCVLAETASRCGNWDVSLDAATNFFQVYRGVVKKDSLVSTTAKAGVIALVKSERSYDKRISEWLDKISQYNDEDKIPDDSYFVADCLYSCLGDADRAIRKLDASEIRIANDMNDAIAKYIEAHTSFWERTITFEDDDLNVAYRHYQDLLRVHALHLDVLKEKRGTEALTQYLLKIVDDMAVSPIEKIRWLHRYKDVEGLDVEGLWSGVKENVSTLNLRYRKNRFEACMPVSWFLVGDVKSRIELYKCGKKAATIEEDAKKRKINLSSKDVGAYTNVVTMAFPKQKDVLNGVDVVKLILADDDNGTLPIEVIFRPSVGFDFQNRRYDGVLKAVEVRMANQKAKLNFIKPIVDKDEDMEPMVSRDVLKKYSHQIIPFKIGSDYPFNTNFLETVSIGPDYRLDVACSNPTLAKRGIRFEVCCYTKYGARLWRCQRRVKMSPGEQNLLVRFDWPVEMKDYESPAYMLFQYYCDFDAWAQWCHESSPTVVGESLIRGEMGKEKN